MNTKRHDDLRYCHGAPGWEVPCVTLPGPTPSSVLYLAEFIVGLEAEWLGRPLVDRFSVEAMMRLWLYPMRMKGSGSYPPFGV